MAWLDWSGSLVADHSEDKSPVIIKAVILELWVIRVFCKWLHFDLSKYSLTWCVIYQKYEKYFNSYPRVISMLQFWGVCHNYLFSILNLFLSQTKYLVLMIADIYKKQKIIFITRMTFQIVLSEILSEKNLVTLLSLRVAVPYKRTDFVRFYYYCKKLFF